jgi:inner membrane protein
MPTIMTHAVVGLGLGRLFTRRRMPALFWLLVAILPVAPDFDVLAFPLGIPYEDVLGHRGLSHSLAFALVGGLAGAGLTYHKLRLRFWDWWGFLFLVAASHGLLDACTNGGLGVAFFAPFDARRYFFPWTPIEVSPIGMSFFSDRGLATLLSELRWVWLPTAAVVLAVEAVRKVGDLVSKS